MSSIFCPLEKQNYANYTTNFDDKICKEYELATIYELNKLDNNLIDNENVDINRCPNWKYFIV